MKIRYSSRLFLYLPFVILLILGAIAALRWWQLASDFEQRLIAANRGRAIAPGVTLHFASQRVSGIPFNIDVLLGDVTMTVNASPAPFVWRAQHVAMHALTYGRAQQIFEAAGSQSLSWTGWDRQVHRFVFVPGSLRASAIETGGRLVRFDLVLDGVGGQELRAARAQFHFRQSPSQDAEDFFFRAEGVELAPDVQTGFGSAIDRISIAGSIRPAAQFAQLLSGSDEWRQAAERWRMAGGQLSLERLDYSSGNLTLNASARLSLDAQHRPAGSLEVFASAAPGLSSPADNCCRLADALRKLSKETSLGASLHALIIIRHGAASVARANATGRPLPAGSIDPLY